MTRRVCAWGREVRHQISGGEVGQRLLIGGGHNGAFLLVRSIRPRHDLHRPPVLAAPITKGPGDVHPLARLLSTHPSRLAGHLLQRTCYALWMPPCLRGVERHHIRHLQLASSVSQATIFSVERISHYRPQRPLSPDRLLDELQGNLGLGAKSRIVLALGKITRLPCTVRSPEGNRPAHRPTGC